MKPHAKSKGNGPWILSDESKAAELEKIMPVIGGIKIMTNSAKPMVWYAAKNGRWHEDKSLLLPVESFLSLFAKDEVKNYQKQIEDIAADGGK